MGRIRRTLELAKSSWRVLQQDRELLWLPVLSFFSWLAVAFVVLGPVFFSARSENALGETEFQLGPIEWVLVIVGYVALAYVTIFFRAAILHAADERLRGGDPHVGSALRGAAAKAGKLLPWAILTVTVSMILRAVEERAGFIGRIVVGLIGLAWTLVTFLTLPILMLEDVGTFAAVKRSAELFKRTWGENVAAQIGLGLIGVIAVIPGIVIGGLLIATGLTPIVVLAVIGMVAWVALVVVVMSALTAIYQMALYHFAVDGAAPPAFADSDLGHAFEPRRGRSGGFGGMLGN